MKKSKNNKFEKLFLWNWRNFVISVILFVVVFFYRNRTIKILFEPIGLYYIVFYGVLMGIPLYLLITLVYSFAIKKIKFKKSKRTNLFLLSWKKTGIALIAFVIAVVIHNLIYAFFLGILGIEFEEVVFFLFANIVIPLYFIISIFYTLIKKFRGKK